MRSVQPGAPLPASLPCGQTQWLRFSSKRSAQQTAQSSHAHTHAACLRVRPCSFRARATPVGGPCRHLSQLGPEELVLGCMNATSPEFNSEAGYDDGAQCESQPQPPPSPPPPPAPPTLLAIIELTIFATPPVNASGQASNATHGAVTSAFAAASSRIGAAAAATSGSIGTAAVAAGSLRPTTAAAAAAAGEPLAPFDAAELAESLAAALLLSPLTVSVPHYTVQNASAQAAAQFADTPDVVAVAVRAELTQRSTLGGNTAAQIESGLLLFESAVRASSLSIGWPVDYASVLLFERNEATGLFEPRAVFLSSPPPSAPPSPAPPPAFSGGSGGKEGDEDEEESISGAGSSSAAPLSPPAQVGPWVMPVAVTLGLLLFLILLWLLLRMLIRRGFCACEMRCCGCACSTANPYGLQVQPEESELAKEAVLPPAGGVVRPPSVGYDPSINRPVPTVRALGCPAS